jgi:quinol monooxygenase YgiN
LYGLILRLTSAPGRRDELIHMMGGANSQAIRGCLSFIVAEDSVNEDVLWVTEVWESQASHEASLEAPPIKGSLTKADVLIIGFEKIAATTPVKNSSHPLHHEGD